ncbi:hypothetical protein [Mucilaginibacter sp.]|uniref:hypothetical protein n=1 Tax=Mucilaginibacter sp. TaxID=1882438 RepID=UPI002ED1D307
MADDEIPNPQDEVTATPQPVKPRPSAVRAEYRSKTRIDLDEAIPHYSLPSPSYQSKADIGRPILTIVLKLLVYIGSIVGWVFIFKWVYHLIFP